MKTKDLIALMQQADPSGEGNVCVPLSHGVGGPRTNITGAYMGFDWYAGQLCLQVEHPVVDKVTYDLQADELANASRWFYLRILPTETSNYFEGQLRACIGRKKPNYFVGEVIKVRLVGTKDWFQVKLTSQKINSVLPRPEYHGVKVETP